MMRDELGDLANFLATRYHEDWTLESKSATQIAERFASEAGSDTISAVVTDLDKLLASNASEDQLDSLIATLGSRYDPRADGRTVRGWLEEVRSILVMRRA